MVLVLWVTAGLTWAIVVCQSCGHEIRQDRETCAHCGVAAPADAAGVVEQAAAAMADEAGQATVTNTWVAAEIAEADTAQATGDYEVARCLLRNAVALDAVDGKNPTVAQSIQTRLSGIESRMLSVVAPCPACGGNGRLTFRPQTISGESVARTVAGVVCRQCAGRGTVERAASFTERRFAAEQGRKRYEALQRARGMIPLGGAWLPAEIETNLTPQQVARIKRTVAALCDACGGFGRTDCATCKSQGTVVCPRRDCKNGWIEQEIEGIGKSKQIRRVKCDTCGGRGRVACATCAGKGSLVCAKCKGSGNRALCAKCDGRGVAPCRRCDGQGSVKGLTCPACRGTGRDVCKTCGGDGRER